MKTNIICGNNEGTSKEKDKPAEDDRLKIKLSTILPYLNERQRRPLIAAEAKALGQGGIKRLSQITGVSKPTIHKGIKELEGSAGQEVASRRVRVAGGGRKKITDKYPEIIKELETLMAPEVRGDPESLLRWTCKSVRFLAKELKQKGYDLSHETVACLLRQLDFSLQGNQKTLEGTKHPDRNEQFLFINKKAKSFLASGLPVLSVDTKKKELVGKSGVRKRMLSKLMFMILLTLKTLERLLMECMMWVKTKVG